MFNMSKRRLLISGGVFIVLIGSIAAYKTFVPHTYAAQKTYKVDGIALGGTDPVGYFKQAKPIKGSPEFTFDWNGATWHFASVENRDLFAASPESYAPQFGGFCAWAVAARKKLYSTQAKNWTIDNGKLYLNYIDNIQKKWEKNRQWFIADGDRFWPTLSSA